MKNTLKCCLCNSDKEVEKRRINKYPYNLEGSGLDFCKKCYESLPESLTSFEVK